MKKRDGFNIGCAQCNELYHGNCVNISTTLALLMRLMKKPGSLSLVEIKPGKPACIVN